MQHYSKLFDLSADSVISDLHPRYVSTTLAKEIAEQKKIPHIQVQHHHAHVASCLLENQVKKGTLAFAFDGSGFGSDGSIWGGEMFLADKRDFLRVGFSRRDFFTAAKLQEGDAVLVGGTLGDHGMTLYAEHENISLSVWPLVETALGFQGLSVMRAPTHGGLAVVLNEFARKYNISFFIDKEKIPQLLTVQTLCEVLGFDFFKA